MILFGIFAIVVGLILVVLHSKDGSTEAGVTDNIVRSRRRGERFANYVALGMILVITVSILVAKFIRQEPPFADWPLFAAIPVLGIPIVLTMLPLYIHTDRTRGLAESWAAFFLGVLIIVAGFSIGTFYIPSALAMIVAAILVRPGLHRLKQSARNAI